VQSYTVLFVDDEPWLTEGLRAILELDDIQCVTVCDATHALRVLESKKIDVLVTDIMMPAGEDLPGVDSSVAGYALIERVRRRFHKVGIICLSVIRDHGRIKDLKRQNVLFFSKGEISLETAKRLIYSKLTGRYSRR
jgi:DNA-binding NarL/FixJ family response regulator